MAIQAKKWRQIDEYTRTVALPAYLRSLGTNVSKSQQTQRPQRQQHRPSRPIEQPLRIGERTEFAKFIVW